MDALTKIENKIYEVVSWVTIMLFLVMVGLCILQVICRYVLKVSLSFTEELARFLFIWTTFLGTAMALKKNKHVKMELLVQSLPEIVQKLLNVLVFVSEMLIYVVLLYSGVQVVSKTIAQTSAAMNVSMGIVYSVVPISAIIMMIFESIERLKLFRREEQ